MGCNLTRFYIDTEPVDIEPGCPEFKYLSVEDVETIDADDFEAKLQQENLTYTRIDY
jgi:hypothetical protein